MASGRFTDEYRPVHVDDVFGQEDAKRIVRGWLSSGRVPGAILISGVYSAGKTTMARIIARALLCSKPGDGGKACGECRTCLNLKSHPSYQELDNAQDRGIDAMRSLAKGLELMPLGGKKKIVILDEAHQITNAGWQAMLKTLEEPPPHVVIIVCTSVPEEIGGKDSTLRNTILSRLSKLALKPISVDDCVAIMTHVVKDKGLSKSGITKEHLIKIARTVHGHPRTALNALDQVYAMVLGSQSAGQAIDTAIVNGFIEQVATPSIETVAIAIFRSIMDGKPGSAIKRCEDNRASADEVLRYLLVLMRQAMLKSNSKNMADLYYAEALNGLAAFDFPDAKFTVNDAYDVIADLVTTTRQSAVSAAEIMDGSICRCALKMQVFLKERLQPASTPAKDVATSTKVDGAALVEKLAAEKTAERAKAAAPIPAPKPPVAKPKPAPEPPPEDEPEEPQDEAADEPEPEPAPKPKAAPKPAGAAPKPGYAASAFPVKKPDLEPDDDDDGAPPPMPKPTKAPPMRMTKG